MPISFDNPTAADFEAIKVFGAALSYQSSSLPPTNVFPADPQSAPFPSPDNATITCLNGVIGSTGVYPPGTNPYLRDAQGAIWSFQLVNGQPVLSNNTTQLSYDPGHDYYFTINGQLAFAATQLLVREGQVFWTIGNGKWAQAGSLDSPAAGVTIINGPPPAWTMPPVSGTAAPPSPSVPPMPPFPVPSSVAPGSSGNILLAGSGTAFPTLTAAVAAAKPGDTIRAVSGVYRESVLIDKPLVIDGQDPTKTILDGSTFTNYARSKGGFVPIADCIIKNFHITGFGMQESVSQLTSGIRPDSGCGYLTVSGCLIDNCQDGIGAGSVPLVFNAIGLLVSGCGLGDGQSHNVYLSTSTVQATFQNCTMINPNGGHALKSRAASTIVMGGTYAASDASVIEFPDGTTKPFLIDGVAINKSPADANHLVIGYAVESSNNGAVGGAVVNSTINAFCQSPSILTKGGNIIFSNTQVNGGTIGVSGGGNVTGI